MTYFISCDLDLDPMTLMYKLDLDILKTYLGTKNEISRSRLSKVTALTGQTHRQTHTQTNRRDRTHYRAAFAGDNILLTYLLLRNYR